jgi:hypothetical protein
MTVRGSGADVATFFVALLLGAARIIGAAAVTRR